MLPNLQIPHWDTPQSPSPLSLNAEDHDAPTHHLFSTDHFRMFQFKVRTCPRGRAHDWTECPFAHPAEKARRRDPRKYHYSGVSCPEFRKGHCPRGDSCEFAHGVFECWLHPSRYRTQLCKDGGSCRRRVCFFAHAPEQVRVLSPDSSSSPTSVLSNNNSYAMMTCESPPSSPYVRELVSSMRSVQIEEAGRVLGWGRGPGLMRVGEEEGGIMERVESGREIRARMYAKLTSESSSISAPPTVPDIGWVSELVK